MCNKTTKIVQKPLAKNFFDRAAELVAPDLIGCILIKRQSKNKIIWGVIVETEAYSQEEPACHGFNRKTSSNKTLFGPSGRWYVYLTYGTYFCVNVVTGNSNWASGVLIRSLAMPYENERIASGPGLLAIRMGINKSHDNLPISLENGLWLTEASSPINMEKIVKTTRIGISKAKSLRWRWYLHSSRSISKREKGDRCPSINNSWHPSRDYLQ
tara:strand:- start:6314 stop:6952 length:639 start_codon:yes stop_codon:yes gene_type:complete